MNRARKLPDGMGECCRACARHALREVLLKRQTILLFALILSGATLLGGEASQRADIDKPLSEYTKEYAELITTAGEWSAFRRGGQPA